MLKSVFEECHPLVVNALIIMVFLKFLLKRFSRQHKKRKLRRMKRVMREPFHLVGSYFCSKQVVCTLKNHLNEVALMNAQDIFLRNYTACWSQRIYTNHGSPQAHIASTSRRLTILSIKLKLLSAPNYCKTCVKRPLKNRQNKDLYDKWELKMKVKSIAECSPWSILQYF